MAVIYLESAGDDMLSIDMEMPPVCYFLIFPAAILAWMI